MRRFKKCESYIISVIKGERKGLFQSLLNGILYLFSWIYRFVVFVRNWAYDKGWLRQYQPPIPLVISVGNLVAGGSGKTPFTCLLASSLVEKGTVGILSRGYRSVAESLSSPVTLCAGKGALHSAAYCGDEPFMLAERLPQTHIFVGKNRYKSSQFASKVGVDILILDDGMQHRKLGRDIEIVVLDVTQPFGNGYFLPRGFLREERQALKRANLIVLTNVENIIQTERVTQEIAKFTDVPTIGIQSVIENIYDCEEGNLCSLKGKKMGAFCGIGNPERFLDTVEKLEVERVGYEFFPDHFSYRAEDIFTLAEKYRELGAEGLLCTEKDKVKLIDIPKPVIPIYWVKMEFAFVYGKDEWENFLTHL